MKSIIPLIFLQIISSFCFAQKKRNPVYALHNMIKGDSVYNTLDKQVAYIRRSGFDGIEISGLDSFDQMYPVLKKYKLDDGYFYFKLNLDTPYIDPRIPQYIQQLKGTGFILAPFIPKTKENPASTHRADSLLASLLKQIGRLASDANLQVAIYPHSSFYIERLDHALLIAKMVNEKNLGLSFNLCHWLATTPLVERPYLKAQLKEAAPYVKMIIINGANNVISQRPVIWDDYILPLGTGDFNTYQLLRYACIDLKIKCPVAVQCYNIKGNKAQLVQTSIKQWRVYQKRLQKEK